MLTIDKKTLKTASTVCSVVTIGAGAYMIYEAYKLKDIEIDVAKLKNKIRSKVIDNVKNTERAQAWNDAKSDIK